MRYHFTPVRMTIIKFFLKRGVGKDVEKLESLHTVVEMQNSAAAMENSMDVAEKIKDKTTI